VKWNKWELTLIDFSGSGFVMFARHTDNLGVSLRLLTLNIKQKAQILLKAAFYKS